MATTALNNNVQKTSTMEIPNVKVKFSNITISKDGKRFSLIVQAAKPGKGRRRFSKETTVEGRVSPALRSYLFDKYNGITNFQRHLEKQGIVMEPGILKKMIFVADNLSESFEECPFKLIMYKSEPQLTLVNTKPMVKVRTLDGKYILAYQTYIDDEGNIKTAFYSKSGFRRLVIETDVEQE